MGKFRDRMQQDLQLAQYRPSTQENYLRCARKFVAYYMRPPTQLGREEIRKFLLTLIDRPSTQKTHWAAIRFLYTTTLRRPEEVVDIPWPRIRQKLPDIFSAQEVAALLEAIAVLSNYWIEPTFAIRCWFLSPLRQAELSLFGPRFRRDETSVPHCCTQSTFRRPILDPPGDLQDPDFPKDSILAADPVFGHHGIASRVTLLNWYLQRVVPEATLNGVEELCRDFPLGVHLCGVGVLVVDCFALEFHDGPLLGSRLVGATKRHYRDTQHRSMVSRTNQPTESTSCADSSSAFRFRSHSSSDAWRHSSSYRR